VEAAADRLAGGEDVVERDHAGSSPIREEPTRTLAYYRAT
jgi:hypothetical protein